MKSIKNGAPGTSIASAGTKKILVIGGATRDIFIHPTHSPDIQSLPHYNASCIMLNLGTKIDVESVTFQTGGGATNAAVSFARLGFDASVVCKVGDDEAGAAILEDLKKNHVKTHLIKASLSSSSSPERRLTEISGSSFILQAPSGDSPVLAYRGVNTLLTFQDVAAHVLGAESLYITSLSGAASSLLLPLVQEAKKHTIFVATNPGGSQLTAGVDVLRKSLPYIDVLILNMHEAEILMNSFEQTQKNSFNLNNFFKKMLDAGVNIIAVTDGAQGVHVATKDHLYFCPAVPTKVVSSVGAGDAFGSCFVASLLQGKSIERAMVCGVMNSASVLMYVGAKTGLLNQAELEDKMQKESIVSVRKSEWEK